MPFLSVIVPTMRVGGLNILFDSLARQEFTDFELVLVDALKPRREDIVEQEAKDRFLRVVHVDGSEHFPVTSYCAMANAGLVAASGEVVVFAVDYTRFAPDTLAKHAEFHRASDGGFMGPHRYVKLENVKFPGYDRRDIELYERDVRAGHLDQWMFSIGDATNENADSFLVDGGTTATWDADPKLKMPVGPIAPLFFHGKNESVRLEAALSINGFDEALDGCHGWQDSDFADRLAVKAGVRFTLDPSCVVDIANPRGVFPFAKRTRDFRTNEGIWFESRARGYPTPNKYSLRERRGTQVTASTWNPPQSDTWKNSTPEQIVRDLSDAFKTARRSLRLALIYGEFSRPGAPFDLPGLYSSAGLTGSESAFFNAVIGLAERGHEVVGICKCAEPYEHPSGAIFFPLESLPGLRFVEGHAVIVWNEPDYLKFVPPGVPRIVLQELNSWDHSREPNWTGLVDVFAFPSQETLDWHRREFGLTGRFEVVPNSCNLEHFQSTVTRRPHRAIWASSPDRGLHHLLDIWPEVRKRVSDAELRIFYELNGVIGRTRLHDNAVGRRMRYIEAALPRLADMGVKVIGNVDNLTMAREYQAAAVLPYTFDPTRHTETFGCTVLDACAGGCRTIISDFDCLPSVHGEASTVIRGNLSTARQAWVDAIAAAMEQPASDAQTLAMRAHAEAHSREKVAAQWERLIGEVATVRRAA